MQLSEMQVLTCLQPMLQERTQRVELQGGEEPPGHYRGTLTIGGSDCMQTGLNYEASLQSSIYIYIFFSGRPRKNSVSSWLRKLSKRLGVAVEVEMVDIQVRPFLDLTQKGVQQRLLNKIATGHYDAVLFSPPCSTFSRVVWANRHGPRPVRSCRFPRGLNRLTWAERKRATWGNTMADFTFKGFELQAKQQDGIAIFENPEDLEALRNGENFGVRPASMWQWEQFSSLLQLDQVTDYLKPTRLLLANVDKLHESFCEGRPTFDDQGFYQGPLKARAAGKQLVGTTGAVFAITGSEQWPSSFCKWVATTILDKFLLRNSQSPVIADDGVKTHSDRTEFPILQPDGEKLMGGHGPPRKCQHRAKRDFSMMELDSHQWGDGTLTKEFGTGVISGWSCAKRH